MKPLRWHPETKEEIIAAAAWYQSRRDGLGEAFVDAVQAAASAISAKPLRFAAVRGSSSEPQVRRAPLTGFPYCVIDEPHADHVLIVAVAHQKRRPGYWAGRRA